MLRPLRGKKGMWVKPGSQGADPGFPGSYGGYMYLRPAPKSYPKTRQQAVIGERGRTIGRECKGKKGADFKACRAKGGR